MKPVLAHFLLKLCSRVSCEALDCGTQEYEVPLTKNDIADALGLTNVHVSQTLKHLMEKGLLVFKNGRLRILSAEGLAKIADLDDMSAV